MTHATSIRVVVADDEPLAARALATELERLGCQVVAVAERGRAAIDACVAHRPDACFTDIAMPDRDGLAVARALRDASPDVCVVFVSAHPQFAVDAFGADVTDYILKPVRRERLAEAVERVRRSQRVTGSETDERLLVTERGASHVIPIREIEWVQADGYTVWLHTARRAWLLRERMHTLESRLATAGFMRVHRSAIVRRDVMVSISNDGAGSTHLLLTSGVRVRVARDRVGEVRALLHALADRVVSGQ
ncbi:MAG: response regulator transcription factor [Gemmatimonadaceae bacterium]|nr:response regulator transcription factor [Gemmatimonadaceae bacterium]